ncbi:MAG: hypothetical protein M3423_09055, partial [Actinomycetota bacterium]|nr:hypothetical protein [Actinomycetota bacterium]
MKKLASITTLGVAGLVGVGVMAFPSLTVAADPNEGAITKRDENASDVVLVDDDDDDTNDKSRSQSRSRDDSRSKVSRDDSRSKD